MKYFEITDKLAENERSREAEDCLFSKIVNTQISTLTVFERIVQII